MSDIPSFSGEAYNPDRLIAGDYPIVTDDVTLLSGEDLVRGTVLGKVTASGKFVASASAAGDGSEDPVAILARDTDASGGDVSNVPVYIAGEFNEDRLTFGTGHDADSVRDALRDLNIYLKSPQSAVDAS